MRFLSHPIYLYQGKEKEYRGVEDKKALLKTTLIKSFINK